MGGIGLCKIILGWIIIIFRLSRKRTVLICDSFRAVRYLVASSFTPANTHISLVEGGSPHPLHPQFPNRRFPSPINPWLSIVLAHIWFSNPYANFSLYSIFSENCIEGRVTQWSEKPVTISPEHTIWVPILVKGAGGEHLFWQPYLNNNGLPACVHLYAQMITSLSMFVSSPTLPERGLVSAQHIRANQLLLHYLRNLLTPSIQHFHCHAGMQLTILRSCSTRSKVVLFCVAHAHESDSIFSSLFCVNSFNLFFSSLCTL